jgi:hypothetical protein
VLFYKYFITGLDRPLGLQEVEAPRISRQSAHAVGVFWKIIAVCFENLVKCINNNGVIKVL